MCQTSVAKFVNLRPLLLFVFGVYLHILFVGYQFIEWWNSYRGIIIPVMLSGLVKNYQDNLKEIAVTNDPKHKGHFEFVCVCVCVRERVCVCECVCV